MRIRRIGLVLACLFLASAASVEAGVDDTFVSEQIVVELADGADIGDISADYGTSVLGSIELLQLYLLELPEGVDEEQFEALLEDDARIEDAELNYRAETAEGQTESFYLQVDPTFYPTQYAWDLIGLEAAHGLSTGAGALLAILDTGVDPDHEALADHIAPGSYNFIDQCADVSDVGDGIDEDGDGVVDEMVGHGTFVAGLAAMMAPDAGLLILKVLDGDGIGESFRVVTAIYYAVEQDADVINLSLALSSERQLLKDALSYARESGVVVVAAAGNLDQEHPLYPAAHPDAIGVASTDAADHKSEFSNYGGHIRLSAPGSEIVSTVPGNAYARWQGTSMSAALISGAAALLKSADQHASPDEVFDVMADAAVDLNGENHGYGGLLGAGRLDVAAALGDPGGIGDLNHDGDVETADLLILLAEWDEEDSPADLDGDGVVGAGDLLLLLANWG
ncbi:MAG: S8 family serine peptidase [Planctomycetota bacterium]|nr:S8 family serine peptidase [Planctomycetota bacterium]